MIKFLRLREGMYYWEKDLPSQSFLTKMARALTERGYYYDEEEI